MASHKFRRVSGCRRHVGLIDIRERLKAHADGTDGSPRPSQPCPKPVLETVERSYTEALAARKLGADSDLTDDSPQPLLHQSVAGTSVPAANRQLTGLPVVDPRGIMAVSCRQAAVASYVSSILPCSSD